MSSPRPGIVAAAKAAGPPLAAGLLLIVALTGWVTTGGLGTIARTRIQVTNASVPLPATAGITAAYLTIDNTGSDPDELLSVHTSAAAQAVLMGNSTSGGSGQMTRIPAVNIPAHGTAVLGPFGLDVMLMKPGPLHVGQTVTLVLDFRTTGSITVQATVTPPGTA